MYFKLSHPDFPQYTFKLLQVDWEIESIVNQLGPLGVISGAYDWPQKKTFSFHGWTDKVNSLWWPVDGDEFATCVLLIDDFRNDVLSSLIEAQRAATVSSGWRWPWVIMSAVMSAKAGLMADTNTVYVYPAESFSPGGVGPVITDTPRVEWKLYPLPPVNLTSLNSSEAFRGLWLLPLVDIRYFKRNTPLNQVNLYSSSAGNTIANYPIINVGDDSSPSWMPPLLTYPKDLVIPANYVPIAENGTNPSISGSMRWGEAADIQADMENWRIVCRDVRSTCNIPGGGGTPHTEFTGIISDYPEDWSNPLVQSYHTDALNFLQQSRTRRAGGECDVRSLDDLTARKLQFLFQVTGSDSFYSITIATNTDYPKTVADLVEDVDGPDVVEKDLIPMVALGVPCSSTSPDVAEHDQLVTAAKQWALLYYAWRYKQAYIEFPDIYPLIPNGHAKVIRWDFGGDERYWRTLYVALEGVQGTDQSYCVTRQPFYAIIDGEGALQDGLHGFYAFTQLLDKDGQLTTHPNPIRGYVKGVNGSTVTIDPARDEYGKVAVPVGLVVRIIPGVPYLDIDTSRIFNHYLFTTSDLLQVVRLKPILEVNEFGHFGATIQRWNPDIKQFVDSKDIWVVILE